MATRFVPFEITTATEQNLRNIDFVRGKLNEAVQAVGVRDGEIERLVKANASLESERASVVAERDKEVQNLRKELATQAGRVQELSDRIAQIQAAVPKIGVQDLVSQFKGNIDRINADVITRKSTGMLVDSVEVEVRGGIDVTDGLRITQLPASALGVASVSVLKFNLRPASVLKIVEDDEGAPR